MCFTYLQAPAQRPGWSTPLDLLTGIKRPRLQLSRKSISIFRDLVDHCVIYDGVGIGPRAPSNSFQEPRAKLRGFLGKPMKYAAPVFSIPLLRHLSPIRETRKGDETVSIPVMADVGADDGPARKPSPTQPSRNAATRCSINL